MNALAFVFVSFAAQAPAPADGAAPLAQEDAPSSATAAPAAPAAAPEASAPDAGAPAERHADEGGGFFSYGAPGHYLVYYGAEYTALLAVGGLAVGHARGSPGGARSARL